MTWKERRTITVLSIILAILSAALLIVLGISIVVTSVKSYRASKLNSEKAPA